MKIFPLGIVNAFATRTPTKKRRPGRALGATKKATNATCLILGGSKHVPYLQVTIKEGSKYSGRKGNDLFIYLVYSSNKTYIEIHDSKAGATKISGRPSTNGVSNPDSIQAIATKANEKTAWNLDFVWSVIRKGNDIAFDAGFLGPGSRFKGGRGR
mgnify:CR=1 FL=1